MSGRTIGAVVGATIGFIVTGGNPAGARWGWTIGSAVGGYFRVRFEGMTADAARAACKTLKAKKQACMVIAP